MSNTVFPFTLSRPYLEGALHITRGTDLGGAVLVRRNEIPDAPGWVYAARFDLRLPRGGQTVDDWDDFLEAREGAYDTFLFKAHRPKFKTVTDEAVGTGDGSTVVFALDKKHIDSSTLVVKVAGATQTGGGTDYTFSGNNTTPIVTFEAGSTPSGGQAVTASYEFYMPVRFVEDPEPPDQRAGGSTSSTVPYTLRGLRIVEDKPGAHLV